MPGTPAIFELLRNEPSTAADQALLSALRLANTETARLITETLLVRNQRTGLLGLVAMFHALDEAIRQQILGKMDELFGVLRPASQSRVEQVRLNVLEVIRRGCAYRAAYLADALLHDRSPHVREVAADTLHALADGLLRTCPVPDHDLDHLLADPQQTRAFMAELESHMEDRRQVVSAIESGLASFNMHLRPKLVEAGMWLADDLGPQFWSVVSVPGSKAARVAIGLMSGSRDPRLVPFLVTALNYAEFRPVVVKMLAGCSDRELLGEWFRQSWRVVEPKMGKAMAALKKVTCIENHQLAVSQLSPDARRHVARCMGATGLPNEAKLDVIRQLQRRGDGRCQRAAAWALVGRAEEQATSMLRKLAHGDVRVVARMAQLELARRRPLEFPPDELVAATCAARLDDPAGEGVRPPETFDEFWAVFDQLEPWDCQRYGRQMVVGQPSALTTLARRLTETDPSDRVRALRIVTLLEIAPDFAEQLYQLSQDPDSEVRSAALQALAHIPNAASKRILHRALGDADSRVQANAIEAMEAHGDMEATTDLVEKLVSPDNRVRANAVKALLRLGVREAAEALIRMLRDENRAQRISALWLVDHMRLSTLSTRIVAIGEADEDPQIRERARALAERLLRSSLQTESLGRAKPPEVTSSAI